ncbi:GspH/FimT family pseudopilin [Alloalcanivorax gelatiniphagus]|nr:GspH/FimT family pseudopilin [Alloalcanivorax gelatiniphagus]
MIDARSDARTNARAKGQGFTIIELMLTIGLAGILLAIAVPSFRSVTANIALRSSAADLITAINTARAQAVNLRKPVLLRPLGNSWNDGWEVFYDSSDTEGDQSFLPAGAVTVESASDEVEFLPSGLIAADAEFKICDDRSGESGRRIHVGRFGVVSNTVITCG